jgi:hypothetical protein
VSYAYEQATQTQHDEDLDDDMSIGSSNSQEGGTGIGTGLGMGGKKAHMTHMTPLPPPQRVHLETWEYVESVEELGLQLAFLEVYEAMKYVKTLRGDVRRLNGTISSLREAQKIKENAAEAKKNIKPMHVNAGLEGDKDESGRLNSGAKKHR